MFNIPKKLSSKCSRMSFWSESINAGAVAPYGAISQRDVRPNVSMARYAPTPSGYVLALRRADRASLQLRAYAAFLIPKTTYAYTSNRHHCSLF
jgi:hypothetical protein